MTKKPTKTVLITGASKGIGFTIATHFVKKYGFRVIGTSRNPEPGFEDKHGFSLLALDLNNPESVNALVKQLPDEIDILINNAGQSQLGAFEDIPEEDFRKLFEINFFGSLRLTKALLPKMRANGKGLIINISSLIASFPLPYYTSYTTSKAAFSAFSFSLNMELNPLGIDVVVIEPNDLRTSIEPQLYIKDQSPYEKLVTKVREKVRSNMSKSEDATVITGVIDKIVTSKSPKPKYVVGGNAGLLIFIKRLINSATQLKLTGKSYKE